jgi:hypothetical protein
MAKPWAQSSGRKPPVRRLARHLIVCEDKRSGADYLRSFQVPKHVAEITVVGGAGNTLSVVEKGIQLQQSATAKGAPYAKVWCVIDRDDHPLDRYQQAFQLAARHPEFTVIWANECFELWYLLHFSYHTSAIGRDDLFQKLARPDRLGKSYSKTDTTISVNLAPMRAQAIRHAGKLLDDVSDPRQPHLHNPSTNLHELIEVLIVLTEAA